MEMNRRDFGVAMAAFAALGLTASAQGNGDADLSSSRVFKFEDLVEHKSDNGGWSRAITHGTLPTGEFMELHETMLPPGKMPHPPHKHRHSEFMMVREGQLEFDSDGTPERVGPGGVIFAASDVMHGLKNVGDVDANYFVIAIGRESGAMPV